MPSDADRFDAWLDGLVSGHDPEPRPTGSAELCRATTAALEAHDQPEPAAYDAPWKDLLAMYAQPVPIASLSPRSRRPALDLLNRLASIAAILALITGLAATAWIYQANRNQGSDETDAFIAATSATPEAEGTPVSVGRSIYDVSFHIPSQEECAVEPMKRGEFQYKLWAYDPVFEIVDNPDAPWADGTDIAALQDTSLAVPVSAELTEEIRQAVRQFVACSYVGSPSQYYTLVTKDFLGRRMVGMTPSSFNAKAAESELMANFDEAGAFANENISWQPHLEELWMPQVPDNALAYQISPTHVAIVIVWMQEDGSVHNAYKPDGTTTISNADNLAWYLPTEWVFAKNATTGVWELDQMNMYPRVLPPPVAP